MEKYFASHIFEENVNGVPIEVLPMSPKDKWEDDRRWTTAASVNGAKKNIRAKIKAALGYNWKEIQHVDMIFGPVKKEVYLGIYNVPAKNVKTEEENAMSKTENIGIETESAIKEEENMEIKTLYKDVDWTDRKAVRKISNQVLSMVIDKKTNEEKHLFSKVFNILYDSGAYMDIAEENDKITVFFGDSGIVIPAKSAIEFAREIYLEVQDPEWVDGKNAAAIRARLADLFKPAPAKQETTGTQQSDTVEKKPAINNAVESAAEKEENKMNDVQGRETQVVNPFDEMVSPGREPDRTVDLKVFAMYKDKKGYVNRTTTFWTKEPEFYVGNVFKNGVKVGSWTWNLEFKYPQYKPVVGSLGGDGATAFNYAYPSDMKKMETDKERVNRTNVNGYLVAITVALAKVGIKTKYQPKKSYGASVMDSFESAPRTVTGRTHKKPEPVVIDNTGIDENDLAFYE